MSDEVNVEVVEVDPNAVPETAEEQRERVERERAETAEERNERIEREKEAGERYDGGDIPEGTPLPDTRPPEEREDEVS